MLKIKLARFGKKKQPMYRIVINEARDKRDGRYVEAIGQYAPTMTPKVLTIDVNAYKEWLKKGAQPTDTVASLFKRYESGNPFPEKAPQLSKKAKAKAAAAKESADAQAEMEKSAEPVAEAPVETPAEEATPTEETATETAPETTEPEAEPAK